MTDLLTHFTKEELEAIYVVVKERQAQMAVNNCYGKDYDQLGTIIRKVERVSNAQ
jgi:hypothetical protein